LAQRWGNLAFYLWLIEAVLLGVAQIDEIGGLGMSGMFIPAERSCGICSRDAWRQTPQTATCTEALVDKLPRRRIGPGRLVNMGRMNIPATARARLGRLVI